MRSPCTARALSEARANVDQTVALLVNIRTRILRSVEGSQAFLALVHDEFADVKALRKQKFPVEPVAQTKNTEQEHIRREPSHVPLQ